MKTIDDLKGVTCSCCHMEVPSGNYWVPEPGEPCYNPQYERLCSDCRFDIEEKWIKYADRKELLTAINFEWVYAPELEPMYKDRLSHGGTIP